MARRPCRSAAKMRPMHTHRYVERLVDLLDPSLNRLHGLDLDEARRRVALRRSGRGPRHRRVVRDRRQGRHHDPHGAVARSADALLPRQAPGGPGAVRRRPHRHAAPRARGRGPRRPVPSELHADGAGAPRRRDPAGRLPGSGSDLHALLHAGARRRCRPISTRSGAATSARRRSRSTSGCGTSSARRRARRSACASRAASTAGRCSC